jgi:hypothetical protein
LLANCAASSAVARDGTESAAVAEPSALIQKKNHGGSSQENDQLLRVVQCKEQLDEHHRAHSTLEAAQQTYLRRR